MGYEPPMLMPVLAAFVVLLIAGRIGAAAFSGLRQPPVLGELFAGVIIGNLGLIGFHGLEGLRDLPGLDLMAEIGVLFLLFAVGLESDLGTMLRVGRSALAVAVLGVVAPLLLGMWTARAFLPGGDHLVTWFVGATLCATSVGITARVLSDIGRTASIEGRIILGAAVIDDVLGLLVLAVITGVIQAADAGVAFSTAAIGGVVLKALGFLVLALVAGRVVSRGATSLAARLSGDHVLPLALAFCFGLAWLAGRAGLAPIVGAFAAGLVLDDVRLRPGREGAPPRDLRDSLRPIESFLVPLFFVLMGMRVDLASFAHPGVAGFAAVLTLAAVAGKQICGLGVFERGADRLAVGLGMIPRGEVGLIFAGVGTRLTIGGERVVGDAVFSAVVVMVALTTLATPPLLAWRLRGSATPDPETA